MPIYQLGQLNTTALNAPGVYIQDVPPPPVINGVPTNIEGIVGVGSWGPVNSAVLANQNTFGPVTFRSRDLSTAIMVSNQLGSTAIMAVRVTDGTDAAATIALKDTAGSPVTGATLTAIYTGIVGNTLLAAITSGTQASTYKLTVLLPGGTPEVYDNITGSGATFWANLVSAVNNGISGIRGPSQLVVATVGSSTTTPNTSTTYTGSGGTDGVSSVTDSTLIGTDNVLASSRKGMYALRGSGAQVLCLTDLTDSTQWATVATFVNSEGMYAPVAGAVGASYATVSTALTTAGVDNPGLKVLVGDWVYWNDTVNNVQRLLSPATFVAAELANLSPQNSTLNKQLTNVTGTQRSAQNQPYSLAEIGAVRNARLDVIANPSPGGSYFGCQTGSNASSNGAINGDNYTRMINYLSLTMASAFGYAIGQPQTPDLQANVLASMDNFLNGLAEQNMIGNVNGGPAFAVQLNAANNPINRVSQGYMQANVQVTLWSITLFFLVNLQAGQTVVVTLTNTQPAA